MLNENAKKWVAALRSGEFAQGKNYLKSAEGYYCCLGVACELYGREHSIAFEPIIYHDEIEGDIIDDEKEQFLRDSEMLPESVKEWLGLNTDDGAFRYGTLTGLNDTGTPFTKIADVIESEPAGLFIS